MLIIKNYTFDSKAFCSIRCAKVRFFFDINKKTCVCQYFFVPLQSRSAIEHESDLIENNLNKFRGNQLPAATKDLK